MTFKHTFSSKKRKEAAKPADLSKQAMNEFASCDYNWIMNMTALCMIKPVYLACLRKIKKCSFALS